MFSKITKDDFTTALKNKYHNKTELVFNINGTNMTCTVSPATITQSQITTNELNKEAIAQDFTKPEFMKTTTIVCDMNGNEIMKGNYTLKTVEELDMTKVQQSPLYMVNISKYVTPKTDMITKSAPARVTFK
jgi:hypothetical protein